MNYTLQSISLLLYIVEYYIAYRIFVREKIRRPWIIGIVSLSAFILCFFVIPVIEHKEMICYGCGFISSLITFIALSKGTITVKIKNLGIALGLSLCIEHFADVILGIIEEMRGSYVEIYYQNVIANVFTVVLFLLILIYVLNRKPKISHVNISGTKWLMVVLAAGVITTIFAIDIIINFVDYRNARIIMLIIAAISTVCVEGLILLILFLRDIYDYQRLCTEQMREMSEMQKRYYEELLEREKETRKFRHDMKKHFLIIREMAEKNKDNGVCEYINSIDETGLFDKTKYEIGNTKINVLTNYYLSMIKNDVEINVIGVMSDVLSIDESALCIIYGNLLQNAVEELNRINKKEKKLEVEINEGNHFLGFVISNTMESGRLPDFKTKKNSKTDHGLGVMNIKMAIEKLKGELEYTIDGDVIKAKVTIPI